MNLNKTIAWLTSSLVFAVAAISFILSYHALQGVAAANGLAGSLSYIWPLLVDFSLVVFSLCVVSAHLYSEATWKQWTLVGISTCLTVFYNALYAYPDMLPPLAQRLLIIGLPPVMLFFSFELLMGQLRNSVKRSQQQATITGYDNALSLARTEFEVITQQAQALQEKHDSELAACDKLLSDTIEQYDNKVDEIKTSHITDLSKRDNALQDVYSHYNAQIYDLTQRLNIALNPVEYRRNGILENQNSDKPLNITELAEKYNVSQQTIRKDIISLNGSYAKVQS